MSIRTTGSSRLAVLTLLWLVGCAVPVPPTGGPPDSTPPTLESSEPAPGATAVSTDHLVFTFSEPVDENSFLTAFSMSPDMEGRPDISRSGRRVKVRLPGTLRSETTYRVTLDVALRDARGVSLDAPVTLAFSTGDTIDRARLSGRVVGAADGAPVRGVDILAFASADSTALSDGPLYRTQTGSDGQFELDYVRPGSYFVVGVTDRNRNRTIDPGEAIAVPPVEAVVADSAGTAPDQPWILASRDALAPTLDRVRAVSGSSIELRFSETLFAWLDAPLPAPDLVLTDSSGQSVPIDAWWIGEDRPRTVWASTGNLAPGTWNLSGIISLADSSGNAVGAVDTDFEVKEGLPSPDAVSILSWLPDSLDAADSGVKILWPIEHPGVRLSRPAADVRVERTDTLGAVVSDPLDPVDGTLYQWTGEPSSAEPFRIRISGLPDDSTDVRTMEWATNRQTGSLGVIVDPYEGGKLIGQLFAADGGHRPVLQQTLSASPFLFDGLPRGFRAFGRFFLDQDGDGTWSPGSLIPWRPAEPLRWITFNEPVRARWETIAADTLRFGAKPDSTDAAEFPGMPSDSVQEDDTGNDR